MDARRDLNGAGRRALVVVNSNGRNGDEAKAALAVLEAGGMTLVHREYDSRDHSRDHLYDVIRAARHEVDCVVLGGGDGTLNAGAQALRDTQLPLGILPLGTANDLARTLSIPTAPEEAAAVILAGHTRRIDLGSVNGRPFFNVASVGLTVEITQRLDRAAKRRLGRLAYPWTALCVLMGHQRFSAVIRCGHDVMRVRTLQVTVGNGRHYGGGGLMLSEDAEIHDHKLAMYSLEPKNRWSLLRMAQAFRAGEHDRVQGVRMGRADVVELVTQLPRQVSADGEIVTVTPARFSVLPSAIAVFAPTVDAH